MDSEVQMNQEELDKPPERQVPDYVVSVRSDFLLAKPIREVIIKADDTPIIDKPDIVKEEISKPTSKEKKRMRETRPPSEERLCTAVMKGQVCSFGEKCTYNHDTLNYLANKPPDLGTICFQYETYGNCPNGIMCRFGSCHIDREKGVNLNRPENAGGVIARPCINLLKKEVQQMLRKRTFKYQNKDVNKPKSDPVTSASADPTVETSEVFDSRPYDSFVKLVDFSNKVYVAPLTTVGNLPFRRILVDFGADITCGEMAMAQNIQEGQASEWALLRRHQSEPCFGIQLAGGQPDLMSRVSQILEQETSSDFVDLNCGCPIDVVCGRGCGSSLMTKPPKLLSIVNTMIKHLTRPITVKLRTGWDDKNPTAHKILPMLQQSAQGRIAAVMIHGRSRLQRYHRLANWEYVAEAARSQDLNLPLIPIVGNGDIFSYEDWQGHQSLLSHKLEDEHSEQLGLCSCAMLGRGSLIKPWLPQEIKEKRQIDLPAASRMDMLKTFCNYGMEHWGSDQQGINTIRKFLLEWLSFLHRYVPAGITESQQRMNQRPPLYFGRCDTETLLSSPHSQDWVKITELLLGPVPASFSFTPKHKSNSYAPESETVSNG